MRRLFHRHQPKARHSEWLKAGFGGLLGIALVSLLGQVSGVPLLMAPFGATCVLLFSAPTAPLSQPANVVGGHLVATAIALAALHLLPDAWWSIPLTVGAAIAVMHALRITHPPAGADPIVVMLAHPGWDFLVTPVLVGAVALVGCAMLVHRLPPRLSYPLPVRDSA